MLVGICLGLAVALLWGACDIISARTMATYRVATLRFCLLTQPVGVAELLALGALALWLRPRLLAVAWPGLLPPLALGSLALAALYAAGCFAVYRGLAAGPLSLVSPLISAQGAVSLLAALALLHERLAPAQLALLVGIVAGVVLASADPRRALAASGALVRAGPRWALLAMLSMGLLNAGIGLAYATAGAAGMLWVILGYRAWSLLLTAAASRAADVRPRGRVPARARAWGATVGLMETSALLVFGWAVARTDTGIASVLASAYPLLPWAWGALVLRERLRPSQCAGVALVLGGCLLLPVEVPLPLLAAGALVAVAGGAGATAWRRLRPVPLPVALAGAGREVVEWGHVDPPGGS